MNEKKKISDDDNTKNKNLYAIHKKGLKSDDSKLFKDNRSLKSLRFSNSYQKTNHNKSRSNEKGTSKRNKRFEIFNESSNIPYAQENLEQNNILTQNKKPNEDISRNKGTNEKGKHTKNLNSKTNSKDSKSCEFPKSSNKFDEISHFSESPTKEKAKKISKYNQFCHEKVNAKTPGNFYSCHENSIQLSNLFQNNKKININFKYKITPNKLFKENNNK